MCGRYTLTTPPDLVQQHFRLSEIPGDLKPRYNISPSQRVAVVPSGAERRAEWFRWGLVPSWAKDPAIGNKLINARGETVAEKPSFRSAFRKRRCLVLADGFYEWKGEAPPKVPMRIRLKSKEPFAFAGLWETWRPPDGEPVRSCTIITTTPNPLMAEIHNRMPVILSDEAISIWLDEGATDPADLLPLLAPFPADRMEAYAVAPLVNSPANDRPECVEPV